MREIVKGYIQVEINCNAMLEGGLAAVKFGEGDPWMRDRKSNMVCFPTNKNGLLNR